MISDCLNTCMSCGVILEHIQADQSGGTLLKFMRTILNYYMTL